jgi:hypothetical protein
MPPAGICPSGQIALEKVTMTTELFEKGKSYTFYFSGEYGGQQVTGRVVSYEHPLVRMETEGLIRIINCASAHFIEAVTRREQEETGKPASAE